jgi:hypothetical protein
MLDIRQWHWPHISKLSRRFLFHNLIALNISMRRTLDDDKLSSHLKVTRPGSRVRPNPTTSPECSCVGWCMAVAKEHLQEFVGLSLSF